MSALQPASPEPDVATGEHGAPEASPTTSATAAAAAQRATGSRSATAKSGPPKAGGAKTATKKSSTSKPSAARKTAASKPKGAASEPTRASKPRSRGTASATAASRQPRRKAAAWPAPKPQAVRPEVEAPTPPVAAERQVAAAVEALSQPPAPVAPQPPVAPEPIAYEPPVAPEPVAYEPPAAYEPPVAYQPPVAPEPVAYEPPVAPEPVAYEPPVAPEPVAYEPPVAPEPIAYEPPVAPEPPAEPVAYVPVVAYEPPVAPQPPVAPVATQPPAAPAAYEPPAAPQPPVAPAAYEPPAAPQPISMAGADIPAALQTDADLAAQAAAAAVPTPPVAPMAPQALVAADVVALDQPLDPAPAAAHDPASAAPPGFTGEHIQVAESPTLLALDPIEDETTRAPAPAPEVDAHIAGSAILTRLSSLLPRRGDRAKFGSDRAATARVSGAVLLTGLLVVMLGAPIVKALASLPVLGSIVDQLDSFHLYPGAYGRAFFMALLATIVAAGIVVVQMEKTAEKLERRQDAVTRLNIGLAGMVTLAIAGGLLTFMSRYGWAAAAASVSFFLATCLVVPLGRLPGARAMAYQPERAWALFAGIAALSMVVIPTLPGLVALVAALVQVRKRWAGISRGDDLHADGPIDNTNRLSAILLTVFVLLASAIGMHAMTLSPEQIRATDVEGTPAIPGTEIGPTIAPPKP